MRRLIRRLTIISCAQLFFPGHATSNDDYIPKDVPMFNLTIGHVGIADDIRDPLRFGVEYRMKSVSRWKIIPSFGYARAENGASYLYSDLRYDFWLNDRWVAIPSFGVGYFEDSDQIQLGHELEFRSGIEIAYRFFREYRLGAALFHLSNGGISSRNPGTEALVLSLCIPLDD